MTDLLPGVARGKSKWLAKHHSKMRLACRPFMEEK